MLFEDVFYPGNMEKKVQVEACRQNIISDFQFFYKTWNEFADALNQGFVNANAEKYRAFRVRYLTKTVENNTIKECVDEIQSVIVDTEGNLDTLLSTIGLDAYKPDTTGVAINVREIGESNLQIIGTALSASLGGIAALAVASYIFTGLVISSAIVSVITGVGASAAFILGGVCAVIGLGSIAFAAVDAVVSAIVGAVERKELQEAADAVKKIRDEISLPLSNAASTLKISLTDIETKRIQLAPDLILGYSKTKKQYVIVDTSELFNGIAANVDVLRTLEVIPTCTQLTDATWETLLRTARVIPFMDAA